MGGYKVLITTSGVGSRLGEITSENNKSLIRVGGKPVLSHIIESYPENCEFIVTLGYYGDYVKQFLQIAYPKLNFKFVWVDNFSGEKSSLAYSISKCKEHLNSPFIYHACDTIIYDYSPVEPKTNYVLGSKKGCSYYSTINVLNNKLHKINKSSEEKLEFDYVGICGINNY
jgi:choline kinase